MGENLQKYDAAAAFLIVIMRLIYDGPRLASEIPVEVDQSTVLQAIALVARFAELADAEPPTAEEITQRLRGMATETEHFPVESREEAHRHLTVSHGATVCSYLPPLGWWCHVIYQR